MRYEFRPDNGTMEIYDTLNEEYFDAEEIVEVLNNSAAEIELLKKLRARDKEANK